MTDEQILQFVKKNIDVLEGDSTKKQISLHKKNKANFVKEYPNYFKENPDKKDIPNSIKDEMFQKKWPIYKENLKSLTLKNVFQDARFGRFLEIVSFGHA